MAFLPSTSIAATVFVLLFQVLLIMSASASASASSLKLFGSQGSRTPLVSWYLNEIDKPFTLVSPRDERNPHPFGSVPCLQDGSLVLFESGAILQYLADKYGGLDTPEKRGACGVWCTWANASLDPVLFKENDKGQVIGTSAGEENRRLRTLDFQLKDRPFLLDGFSVADVAVASYLLYIPQFFGARANMGRYENLVAYMKRCASRPAYRKAYPEETDGILAVLEGY